MSPAPSRQHLAGAVALATFFAAGAAHAELGGPVAGVQADSVRMRTHMASRTLGTYARHDLTRDNGGLVREYTNAKGEVFAVSWSGPGKPDLRVLLGRYFPALQRHAIGRTMHALRRPPQVAQGDLQLQASGHMGWFHGVAVVPSLAPQGFSAETLPVQP